MRLDELTERATATYDALGPASWPNPHPDGAEPRDEEYSRVTDVHRYDIVHARARAWAETLDDQPDCGCDACDFGSADLLGAVDQAIGQVVGGPIVLLRARRWSATWYPDGGEWSADGTAGPDFNSVMRLCRRLSAGDQVRLPRGCEEFVGQAWVP